MSAATSHVACRSPTRTRCATSSRKSPRPSRAQDKEGRLKVYVSVDMEGIGGISHSKPTDRADAGYPAAVALMVGEANAAIEGAFDGGAAEVVVNDSHGSMFNLTPIDL